MNGEDFGKFFHAIHDCDPFPWQSRLAREVCSTNVWPNVLDLPTGSGKTSCIDVALYHWLVAARSGAVALAARRIAFVVDRRIIVDEAAERAVRIADAITSATRGVLAEARAILAEHTSDDSVGVFTLRGGVARERNLARDPTRVTVVLSTVDQLGSRLLFRGYGVTDRMKPLHAGLFGVDTLLLLDEAHIAEPFRQTLDGVVREQGRATANSGGPRPLRWAQLSATPVKDTKATVFSLADDDRAHPTLSKRLRASKPMALLEVGRRDDLPAKFVELVRKELELPALSQEEAPRIGLVVNRVASARAIHETLRKALKDTADVELLIGRVRPIERDARLAMLRPTLRSSVSPRPGTKPVVVVATQTIEVGADFDFHTMFVEAASYSSIKQRVGRLNRLGVRDAARGAIVLVREDAEDDPIYGQTIEPTWALLLKNAIGGVVDLSISKAPLSDLGCAPLPPPTPHLSPSLLSLLVQTSPRPAVEPEVAEFLHGFSSQVPDVSVVWRAGLLDATGEISETRAQAVLSYLPPLSTEAMSLPFSAFRQWSSGWGAAKPTKLVDGGDIEGDAPPEFERDGTTTYAQVLRVSGDDVEIVSTRYLRPGDMLVVPSERGGADTYGFKPLSTEPVRDLSLIARDPDLRAQPEPRAERRERVLVWTSDLAKTWLPACADEIRAISQSLHDDELSTREAAASVEQFLDMHVAELPDDVRRTFAIVRGRRPRWVESAEGDRVGLVLREGRVTGEDLTEEGAGLQRSVRVSLAAHSAGVGELAERYARSVGLEPSLVRALRAAGSAHDLGKADPRFQKRLNAAPGEMLAKSDEYDATIATGERHEVYSVAILDTHPHLFFGAEEHTALIRYLVGTHHGHGRAAHPMIEDHGIEISLDHEGQALSYVGRPALHALGSGWAELFVGLQRSYGPWMLAFLEAVLRLADHRRSELEVIEANTSKEGAE